MEKIKPQRAILAVWRVYLVIAACVPAFLASLLFGVGDTAWIIITVAWLALFFFFFLWYFPLRYKKLSFSLSDDSLTVYSGTLYTITRTVPLDNIQFTGVFTSPLHRMFGLATLLVTAPGGRVLLPGLRGNDARALANVLLDAADA